MAYDWKGEADKVAAKMPRGVHRVKIARVIDGGKSGKFRSKNGDPQIMVIFATELGAEAGQMFTLSDKAAWTLAKLISRADIDGAELTRQGIEPKHFANVAIAEEWLKGRELWIHLDYEEGNDGKSYARIEPLTEEEASAAPAAPLNPPRRESRQPVAVGADPFADAEQPPPHGDEDDIPF